MSAWIVSKAHIRAMVSLGVSRGLIVKGSMLGSRMSELGQMLINENVASVRYRYPDSGDQLPGPNERYWLTPYRHDLVGPARVPTPVEGLKLINCYEYQSCEHPGWEDSDAHKWCQDLESALIHDLPGYDEAPWDWEEAKS